MNLDHPLYRLLPLRLWSARRLGLYQPLVEGEKFFQEAPGYDHYDARFFRDALSPAEIRETLRALLGAFSELCLKLDCPFFLVHGSLVGWYWGRRMLPWDADIDVSVSLDTIRQLQQVQGQMHNGEFLLEINPHYRDRRTSNRSLADHREPNKIDGRFIDRGTGVFIDITGFVQVPGGLLVSKCPHIYRATDVYPLRKGVFEGVEVGIPARAVKLLAREYGWRSLLRTRYQGYRWNRDTRRWQPDQPRKRSDIQQPVD